MNSLIERFRGQGREREGRTVGTSTFGEQTEELKNKVLSDSSKIDQTPALCVRS